MSFSHKNIFEFIKSEETRYAQDIEVMENWNWNMKEHIRMSILMKHGKYIKATNEWDQKNPKKNIVYPYLNLRYRAEDIDLKDIDLYVNSDEKYHLSFLVKKYHDDVYVREHDLDTFFDEVKEEKIDLGGALVRKTSKGWVHERLDSIAFCDQTSLLSGPIGFKEFYSPDELLEKAQQGWGEESNGADMSLEDLIMVAEEAKQQDAQNSKKTQTPGKYIEIYRVHGSLPSHWLQDDPKRPTKEKFTRQMQIVAFYQSEGLQTGVTLYRKKEHENPFKQHLSGMKIRNRALAFGGVEELMDPQIWTDYSEIQKRDILYAVSKVVNITDDQAFANKNSIKNMQSNQILTVAPGSKFERLRTDAPNFQLFDLYSQEWDKVAQTTSGATEPLLGKRAPSGTPFRETAVEVQQGMGLHEYRQGKYATFIAELYVEGIIPDIGKELKKGAKFLATLTADEMEYITNCVVRFRVNQIIKNKTLDTGEEVLEEDKQALEQLVREEFQRGGNKRFLEILADEIDESLLAVKVNVAGKQKDLVGVVDRMSNIFRQVFANPVLLQDPKAVKVFNKLIQYSGMDPIDFGYTSPTPPAVQNQIAPPPPPAAPMQPPPMMPTTAQPQYA